MVQINFAQKQVNAKIVYYGPGMSGKTTNLEVIHQRAPEQNRGDLTSISTDGDRTLFFDFMPLDLGTVAGMRTCFQIYTVPGQVYYNSTRKLVLQGVDGVVFVADSSASMVEENLESMRNLEENLNEYGKSLSTMPLVIQWNKRDLPDALPVDELEQLLNRFNAPTFEGVANTGQGVFPTLKALAGRVLEQIHQSYGSQDSAATAENAPISSGMTGFYQAQPQAPSAPGQPAGQDTAPQAPPVMPNPIETPPVQSQPAQVAAQQQPMPVPQQPLDQTGFQQQPLDQTGFQQPATAAGAPGMHVQADPNQPFADPMAKTNVHAPPPQMQHGQPQQMHVQQQPMHQQPGVPQQGQTLRMAQATPPAMQQQQAAPQPQQRVATMDPQSVPQQAAPMMQAEPGGAVPQQQAANNARSFPVATNAGGTRLRPRAAARPTPVSAGGNKNAMFTGIFVVAALGIGAVLGRVILSLF